MPGRTFGDCPRHLAELSDRADRALGVLPLGDDNPVPPAEAFPHLRPADTPSFVEGGDR